MISTTTSFDQFESICTVFLYDCFKTGADAGSVDLATVMAEMFQSGDRCVQNNQLFSEDICLFSKDNSQRKVTESKIPSKKAPSLRQ